MGMTANASILPSQTLFKCALPRLYLTLVGCLNQKTLLWVVVRSRTIPQDMTWHYDEPVN